MAEALTPEKQIEALNKQVADLTKKSEQKDRTIDQLTKERDQATTAVGEKVDRIRELEGEAEANEQVIAGYEAKLSVAEAGSDGSTIVTHQEKHYRVLVPQFQFEGQKVKAEALATDATLVAKLVEAGSGLLELVK